MQVRTKVLVASVAAVAALAGGQIAAAAPTGAQPPDVIASALDGSALLLSSCDGTSSTTTNPGFLKVERPNATSGTIAVDVTYGGSLVPGTDYDALPDPIEIPAGETQTIVSFTSETAGTVTMTVEPGNGYQVGAPATATSTIVVATNSSFCTEAIVETINVGEQPTPFLVEEEYGSQVGDTSFEPYGEAPPGLTLERDGSWSGAATTTGTYEITGRWCLGNSCTIEVPWRITVVDAGEPTAPAPPPATAVSGQADFTG